MAVIERIFGAIRFSTTSDEPRLAMFMYADGFSVSDFEAAMEFVARYASEQGRLAILSEVRGTIPAGAAMRKQLGEIVVKFEKTTQGAICASAVVTDSALMRGVLTAVGWVHSPGYPIRPFATDDEAKAWLRSHLARQPAGR